MPNARRTWCPHQMRNIIDTLPLSILTAMLAAVAGLLVSFHVDADPAASIVVILTALFGRAFLFAPRHGLLWRRSNAVE
jgi:ABC-type Mn2+/Zn2+ transport system permease subunit